MNAALRKLFEHYRAHHEMDRPLLQWIGIVGCIAFPLFYALRRMAGGAPGYDDWWLRMAAALLCLGLALRRWWPQQIRGGFIAYSWFVVFYCLSFLLSYTMLRNHGGTPQVINMVVGAVLIILLADWRNAILMLMAGYVTASIAYQLTDPQPEMFREFMFAAGGSLLLVAGGAVSHQGQKRVEVNRMRRLYSGLAGSIAHEMRNPLAQVRHALDSIAATLSPGNGAAHPRLSPEQIASVMVIVQQGREAVARGLQAIELTLQQLQPAPPDASRVQTVDALACVRQAVDAFAYEDAGQRSRVQVRDEGNFRFRGDPTAIELVLFNLLKNALYYLPLHPGMTLTITISESPVPRIVVLDTGPGIPEERLPRLFEEFQTAGKAEGTGLGLAFCRRIMQTLGGNIQCRSELGRFTEFTLSFPPAAPEPLVATQDATPNRRLAGCTVLVVDDQALNRAIARLRAQELGLQVIEASHGQQALDLLRGGAAPDAVLMDINMPGLDGFATTRLLRELPGPIAWVPVLALTANDSAAVRQAAQAAGLQGVLGKPIDAGELERALGSLLQGQETPPALDADAAAALLNTRRIDDFKRLGLLDELLPGALADMRRHVQQLSQAEAAADGEGARQALHALVGLSGEAGAQGLHGLARQAYAAVLDGHKTDESAAAGLQELLSATEMALSQHYGVHAPEDAPPR